MVNRAKLYDRLVTAMSESTVETWFDMGLFLDQLIDNRKKLARVPNTFKKYKTQLKKGVAFLTFDFGIDGVTVEISKYTLAIERLFDLDPRDKSYPVHWISGDFKPGVQSLIGINCKQFVLEGANGFDEWDGYHELFHTRLERGSATYNALATKVWAQAKKLSLRLGKYVIDNDIHLLFPVNICSNPGNVPLSFALVIVSELLEIPVLNSNHDCYWENGARSSSRKPEDSPGVRDHFFCNAHVGEVFSLIEILYPWDSPLWFQANINNLQSRHLIDELGFHPLTTSEIPTEIDLRRFTPVEEPKKRGLLKSLGMLFAKGSSFLSTQDARKYCKVESSWLSKREPILLGNRDGIRHDFSSDNLLILQPTRIIARKQIFRDFDLLDALFKYEKFKDYFTEYSGQRITLLVTGPVMFAHQSCFEQTVEAYVAMLERIPAEFRERVHVAFSFGRKSIVGSEQCVLIHEIYTISDLVLLPSKTEGRGLPIIESSASMIPIVVRKDIPERVFSEVIGLHLDESQRIKVLEFPDKEFGEDLLEKLFRHLTDPEYYYELLLHNRNVVKKRYSYANLVNKIEQFLNCIWQRSMPDKLSLVRVKKAFSIYNKATHYDSNFSKIVLASHRKYLPGYGYLQYMIYLKSLIDPSFFRVEEKEVRGRTMVFAERKIRKFQSRYHLNAQERICFFKDLDNLFSYFTHEESFATDHSMSYRHRNRRHYPYRQLTEHELYGMVAILFRMVTGKRQTPFVRTRVIRVSRDMKANIHGLLGNQVPVIDDRVRLMADLQSFRSLGLFVGKNVTAELRVFALLTLRLRLGVNSDSDLTPEDLMGKKPEEVGIVTLFVREKAVDNGATYHSIRTWLKKSASVELGALYKAGFLKVVKTEVLCAGTHLAQLGKRACAELIKLKEKSGFVIACEDYNMATFDMLDIQSYRVGRTKTKLSACFMGIKQGESYVLWIPAGLRPNLAYPTPIQTPLSFHKTFHSELFLKCVRKFGEAQVLKELRTDADRFGNPVEKVLTKISTRGSSDSEQDSVVISSQINGLYGDGAPWSGAIAKLDTEQLNFDIVFSGKKVQTVLDYVCGFEQGTGKNVEVAWNGGYILNPELVGKLGLPEDYIGTPLGLVISASKIISVPLYNKPSLMFGKDGGVRIDRVRLKKPIEISVGNNKPVCFEPARDGGSPLNVPLFYDLFSNKKTLPAKDCVLFRLAGTKIVERISEQEQIDVFPVGLVLSIPNSMDSSQWKVAQQVSFRLSQFDDICNAVEAGPLLVKNGKLCISMRAEGWKTKNSISTQAARVDFIDLRGPKIGVGIDQKGQLIVIAVNGRIRESVGATHTDLGNILLENGAVDAMGFDPGGSVTLVVGKQQLNISPYNKAYEFNPYSMPPEPRFVGSAVMGTLRNQ